jgi:hypothetical protein
LLKLIPYYKEIAAKNKQMSDSVGSGRLRGRLGMALS